MLALLITAVLFLITYQWLKWKVDKDKRKNQKKEDPQKNNTLFKEQQKLYNELQQKRNRNPLNKSQIIVEIFEKIPKKINLKTKNEQDKQNITLNLVPNNIKMNRN